MAITITENRTFAYSSQTYNVQFFTDDIHTTVTADAAVVTDWINGIQPRRVLIVGLDAEWRPSFGSPQYNPVATLQLCVGNRCLIYQIIHSVWIPASLASFLSDSRQFGDVTFVGVGIKTDLEKLQRDYGIGGVLKITICISDVAVLFKVTWQLLFKVTWQLLFKVTWQLLFKLLFKLL
ncbi:uncharacterized protein LOC131011323 [Salvia miltiorrhiza]|uniref:uncharacterized protein LOC131011323 n=1 Tax=Salvia miltiorrhiza TaxID=226208 RepID=UPI0025ACC149|nr:uncharacterized protein LOC131011323 [Salvia miltiorrhiza]